jgi:hypothetical protein
MSTNGYCSLNPRELLGFVIAMEILRCLESTNISRLDRMVRLMAVLTCFMACSFTYNFYYR